MSAVSSLPSITNIKCTNCGDDEASVYYRSIFNKQHVFCSECSAESEHYMHRLWMHDLKQELIATVTQKETDRQFCSDCLKRCGDKYTQIIYWKSFTFCSDRCQYNYEFSFAKCK